MKVFISQSLERSCDLALALEPFIRKVIPGTTPWVSQSGADKGSRFMSEIRDNLNEATGGIVCLTRENLNEPWILYEAGALSTKVLDRVWTFLLDLDYGEVPPPMGAFQHSQADKADALKMVKSIHKTLVAATPPPTKVPTEADVESYFNMFWDAELGPKIAELRAKAPIPRAPIEPVHEILGLVRQMGDRVGRSSWQQEKTLGMLNQIYRATVGNPSPSLQGLAELQRQQASVDGFRTAAGRLANQSAGTPLALRMSQPNVTIVEPILPPEDEE